MKITKINQKVLNEEALQGQQRPFPGTLKIIQNVNKEWQEFKHLINEISKKDIKPARYIDDFEAVAIHLRGALSKKIESIIALMDMANANEFDNSDSVEEDY